MMGTLQSCLDAILASDGIREEPEMARLLIAIRDEVLEAASEQMSPEFRVVDVISKAGGQTERKEIAHAAVRSLFQRRRRAGAKGKRR